jgi:response regulator RpfG family c-di-GMP phosphodiesterase
MLKANNFDNSQFLMNLTVLVVDDDLNQLEILKDFIGDHGGHCLVADSFLKSIDYIESYQFDVVICDICLSDSYTGFDFVDKASEIDPELTVILSTAFDTDQFIKTIIKKNIYAFLNKPYKLMALGLLLLQGSRNTRNLRRNTHVSENLRTKIVSIKKESDKIFFNTLTSLTNALEQKDEYTKNHSEMVGCLSEKICLEYTNDKHFTEDVSISGRLHDIGKIGIKDEILFKKEKLTSKEYEIIKKHPEMSYKIVQPVDTEGKISSYVLHHHERWNGEGYPHKLKDKFIPLGARILAVADTFNALVSSRPYRKAQDTEYALNILFDGKSIEFDPEIVDILYKIVKTNRVH